MVILVPVMVFKTQTARADGYKGSTDSQPDRQADKDG